MAKLWAFRFNSLSSDQTFFAGTVTFAQPSRESSALTGSLDITITVTGQEYPLRAVLQAASVTVDGALQFNYHSNTDDWGFFGTIDGNTADGNHVLSSPAFEGTIQGLWTFRK